MESDRLIVNVCKDGSLGSFSENKRGRKGNFLSKTKRRIIFAKNAEYTM
jgi:hypothetical protein